MRILVILALLIVAGCEAKEKAVDTSKPVTPVSTQNAQVTSAAVTQQRTTSDGEKLALEFTELFFNSFDVEKRKAFIDQHIHPNSKELFKFIVSLESFADPKSGWVVKSDQDRKILSPKSIGSVEEKTDGKEYEWVLIEGENREIIVLLTEGKIVIVLNPEASDEKSKQMFRDARAKFK